MKKIKKFIYHKQHHSWEDLETAKKTSKSGQLLEMLFIKVNEIIDELNKLK